MMKCEICGERHHPEDCPEWTRMTTAIDAPEPDPQDVDPLAQPVDPGASTEGLRGLVVTLAFLLACVVLVSVLVFLLERRSA